MVFHDTVRPGQECPGRHEDAPGPKPRRAAVPEGTQQQASVPGHGAARVGLRYVQSIFTKIMLAIYICLAFIENIIRYP